MKTKNMKLIKQIHTHREINQTALQNVNKNPFKKRNTEIAVLTQISQPFLLLCLQILYAGPPDQLCCHKE